MDKKIIGTILIVILALVTIVAIESYLLFSKTVKTNLNSPSPTPTPTFSPTPTITTPTQEPASSNSTPSVPTFTVTLTNTSYTVPTTYSTDPQTGVTVTNPGHFVNRENLTFIIQNQPYVNYYLIRWITPYATNWTYLYEDYPVNATLAQSSGSETVWALSGTYSSFSAYSIDQLVNGYTFSDSLNEQAPEFSFESNATIEFQVQAVDGQHGLVTDYNSQGDLVGEYQDIYGPASAWSNTQTVSIP
jgi:hypothetical protein